MPLDTNFFFSAGSDFFKSESDGNTQVTAPHGALATPSTATEQFVYAAAKAANA